MLCGKWLPNQSTLIGRLETQSYYHGGLFGSKSLIIFWSIVCAGDVQLNPGPVKPNFSASVSTFIAKSISCQIWKKIILGKFKLCCFDCQEFFHHKCIGISPAIARHLIADPLSWYCPDCCAPCIVCDGDVLRHILTQLPDHDNKLQE